VISVKWPRKKADSVSLASEYVKKKKVELADKKKINGFLDRLVRLIQIAE